MMSKLRQNLKSATGSNLWLRYALLAPWRLCYAAASAITKRNIAGHFTESEDWMQQYAHTVFNNYKLWAGIERFYGRAAEIGPGDVSGVAELLLADGCSHVDQIDRFRHERRGDPRITQHLSTAEEFFQTHRGYDFILSCAVLEHLTDPLAAVRAMAAALNPGGMMIHAVDCRDHGQFSDRLHDLSFLRIPPVLYAPLKLASGLNRVRLSSYLEVLESLGLNCRVLVTSLSGAQEKIAPARPFEDLDPALIEQSRRNLGLIRPKLAKPFRDMDDAELMISGFGIIARTPNRTDPLPKLN